MDAWVQTVMAFIADHRVWAGPIVAALAFAESLAFISVFVPFTTIIVASGALIGSGMLDPWIVLPWGIAGAAFGDALSYWIGLYFDQRIAHVWPFRTRPELLENGHRFFRRWGVLSVCLGRFFGPLRAVVPLVAGMMDMPQLKFQIANVASAILWLPLLVLPGAIAGSVFSDVANFGERSFGYIFLVLLAFPLLVGLFAWLRRRWSQKTPAAAADDSG